MLTCNIKAIISFHFSHLHIMADVTHKAVCLFSMGRYKLPAMRIIQTVITNASNQIQDTWQQYHLQCQLWSNIWSHQLSISTVFWPPSEEQTVLVLVKILLSNSKHFQIIGQLVINIELDEVNKDMGASLFDLIDWRFNCLTFQHDIISIPYYYSKTNSV